MSMTILVPATGGDGDSAVFNSAFDLARRFDGHLDFLYARPSPGDMAANLAVEGGMGLSAGLIDKLEQEAEAQEAAVHQLVQQFAAAAKLTLGAERTAAGGVTASWHAKEGRENDWLPHYARTSDLTVIGRPAKFGAVEREALEAALFDSGRPVFMPGSGPVALDTVAVAWKSAREAARAVAAASPFMAKAKRIVVFSVNEGGRDEQADGTRLVATLRRTYKAVEFRYLDPQSRPAPQALLDAAGAAKAGLLVMGAYGHSRLREWVFGGVTEHVLRNATLPLLMAH